MQSFLLLRERVTEISAGVAGVLPPRFLVIDDTGGVDPEIEQLRDLDDVRVLVPPFNLGHQRAIVLGVRLLTEDLDPEALIVTMDADGEDKPEDLPRLLAAAAGLADGEGVVLARRRHRQESIWFKCSYLIFKTVFKVLSGVTIKTGNFAAYRAGQARRLLAHPAFDLSYSSAMLSLDIPRVFVDCDRGKRLAGQSKMNFPRLAIHALRMLMPFLDRIAMRTLAVFAVAFVASGLLALGVFLMEITSIAEVPSWTLAVLASTFTVCLFSFGSFVTLFAVFSQSRAISLSDLEDRMREPLT